MCSGPLAVSLRRFKPRVRSFDPLSASLDPLVLPPANLWVLRMMFFTSPLRVQQWLFFPCFFYLSFPVFRVAPGLFFSLPFSACFLDVSW